MGDREVNLQTVDAIEGLHQTALKRIGVLIEGNHLDDACKVAEILTRVGIV